MRLPLANKLICKIDPEFRSFLYQKVAFNFFVYIGKGFEIATNALSLDLIWEEHITEDKPFHFKESFSIFGI